MTGGTAEYRMLALTREKDWMEGLQGEVMASQGVILSEAVLQTRLEWPNGGVVKEQSMEISKPE